MSLGVVQSEFSTDVLIVGAGPAGLVTAAACIAGGLNVAILDYKANVGGWSNSVTSEELAGPPEAVTLSDAGLKLSVPQNPTAKDVNSYMAAFAAQHGVLAEERIHLHCRLTHLSRVTSGSSTIWQASFENLDLGKPCRAFARTVVLCTGHGLLNGCDGMGLWEEPRLPAHSRVLHARQACPSDVAGAIAAGNTVAVIGDGTAAHDCAAALALLLDGKGVTLVERPVEGGPAFVLDGASLLEGARRRALHAALQPHPSLPPPGAVDRVLRAPTKRRFWAYVKSRAAAAAVSLGGVGSSSSGSRLSAPGIAAFEIKDASATITNGEVSLDLPPELMQRHLVLWAPSFRDPRVMPFLEPCLRGALLLPSHGDSQPPPDQLVLYRGVVHPEVPGLAFVGWKAHAATPLLVLELQAQWLVALLTARLQLPQTADMYEDIARQRAWRAAALASPLMSSRGSLARKHDEYYVRQLLADLTGIVELRPRSSLPPSAPMLLQQPLQRDVNRADAYWSERVIIPLAQSQRPAVGAPASSMYGTYVGSSHNGKAVAERGSHRENLDLFPSPSGPQAAAICIAGCRMRAQLAPQQVVPEWSPSPVTERASGRVGKGDPFSGDGAIDAGCLIPACGGMLTYLGRPSRSPKLDFLPICSSVTTAPELQLSMEAAAGRSAAGQIPASPRQALSLLPCRQGVSDTGFHGGSGSGGMMVSGRSGRSPGSTQDDSLGMKLPTKAQAPSGLITPSGHVADLKEYSVNVDNEASTAAAVTATAIGCNQTWAMDLGKEALAAAAAAVDGAGLEMPGEGQGVPLGASSGTLWERGSSPAISQIDSGGAAAVAAHGRRSATSLPLLKLLPLARFAPAVNSGVGGAPDAVPAQARAAPDSVSSRMKQSQRRGGASMQRVKRSAPRRSLSYSDVISIQRNRAPQLHERRRTAVADAATADADASLVTGTPHTLEAQLAALRSHLLDPSAVPFPRVPHSARLENAHAAAGAPPADTSAIIRPQSSHGARQPAPALSGLVTSPAPRTANSPVGGVGATSPLLHLSRCSQMDDEEAEDRGKRLTTIQERHLPDSGCEPTEHQGIDAASEEPPRRTEVRQRQQPGNEAAAREVVPKMHDGVSSIGGGSGTILTAIAAGSGSRSTVTRRLLPRRSQTTSCLGASASATADVTGQKPEGTAASMTSGETSPAVRPLCTPKAGLVSGNLATTEAFLERISLPRSVGGGSLGHGASPFRSSAGGSPSGGHLRAGCLADSTLGPLPVTSRLARPAFASDHLPMAAPSLASPGTGAGSSGNEASGTPPFASRKAKLISAADKPNHTGAAAAAKRSPKGSSPRNITSVLKLSDTANAGGSGKGLSKSIGGLLGVAAEAARLPYSERINEAAPSATQYDLFLRPRRAMATDTAAAAMAAFKATPRSPLDKSYGSPLYDGSDLPERKSPIAATSATSFATQVMMPALSSPQLKGHHDFNVAGMRKHGASGAGGIVTAKAAAGWTEWLPSPPLSSPLSLPPVPNHDMGTREEGEGGLFDMDVDGPRNSAAAAARAGAGVDQTEGIGAVATAKGGTGADVMAGFLLSAGAPSADAQMQTQESVSSLDRRLIETVQALAAASGGGGGGGTGGGCVQATDVSLQKKLTGGGFAEAGAPADSDSVSGGAVVASDGRRGPAWVIRRASQARQDQIVGEISSWLREALVRKASNAPERPDAAVAFTEDGGEDGGVDAVEDGEASAGRL
ncbi:hypothetical protein VaNZ11_008901, partial [Volvox africanus]